MPRVPLPGARPDYPINLPVLQDGVQPRETWGLHAQMRRESAADYQKRILLARRAMGFLGKDPLLPDEQIFDKPLPEGSNMKSVTDRRGRYLRSTSKIHRAKIEPSHGLYDPEYAARWLANQEARRQRNVFVAEQVNTMVREWNLRNSNMRPSSLVEIDEDPGDDLYPLFEYRGTRVALGGALPEPPVDGDLESLRRMSKYRCEHCRKKKKFCSIMENDIIPCELCLFHKVSCTGSKPMPAALRNTEGFGKVIEDAKAFWRYTRQGEPGYNRPRRVRQPWVDRYAEQNPPAPRGQPRGRSASPLREVDQRCVNCVQRGEECDMARPCQSCIKRGESYLCDASVQGQAYGREFDFQEEIFGNEEASPPMTRQEQTLQDSDSWNTSLRNLANADLVSAPYNSSQQGTQDQEDQAQAISSTGGDEISPYAEAEDTFVLFDDDDWINRTIHNSSLGDNSAAERQLPYRPRQEMQNAASTWGMQHQLDPPAPDDPIIVDHTMADAFDIPIDFDLNEFAATVPTPDFPADPNLQPSLEVPGTGVERAFVAKWMTPNGATSLAHVDVLSGYPDRGAGNILREREDTNCNEQKFHFIGVDFGPCWRKPASRCEYQQVGQPGFFWQGPPNHINPNPYHTCVGCHEEQNAEAQNWELAAKAGMKAFVCFGCSMTLTAGAMTRFNTCVCMDKLNKDWLCHDHRAKGYDQITRASGVVGEWLITAGGGRALCPRCYVNYEDESSMVYTCKSCRTYVQVQ